MAGLLCRKTERGHTPRPAASIPNNIRVAFERRCSLEAKRLQSQLSHHLQEDISRSLGDRVFCDLRLEVSRGHILTHRCILAARAANFYSLVCADVHQQDVQEHGTSWSVKLPAGVCDNVVHDFIKNVYILEDPSESETRVLSYLQQFYVASPDSEAYETPQCSPDDSKDGGFCEDLLGRSSAHFYSLVPLDEVCRSTDLLEQELEEQDELIRSFQCIQLNSKLKKPTCLQLSSRRTKPLKLESFLVEEALPLATCDSETEDVLLSCISSPCSIDMDPSSRTLDSGVDLAAEDQTMSQPTSCSPVLPRDHTDTSGLSTLDDTKHNCTTMASISDAESDHEFPDEPADLNHESKSEEKSKKLHTESKPDCVESDSSNLEPKTLYVSSLEPKMCKMEISGNVEKITCNSKSVVPNVETKTCNAEPNVNKLEAKTSNNELNVTNLEAKSCKEEIISQIKAKTSNNELNVTNIEAKSCKEEIISQLRAKTCNAELNVTNLEATSCKTEISGKLEPINDSLLSQLSASKDGKSCNLVANNCVTTTQIPDDTIQMSGNICVTTTQIRDDATQINTVTEPHNALSTNAQCGVANAISQDESLREKMTQKMKAGNKAEDSLQNMFETITITAKVDTFKLAPSSVKSAPVEEICSNVGFVPPSQIPRSSSKQKLSPVTDDIALKSAPDSDASAIPRSSSKQKLSPVTNDIAVKSAPDSDASAIPRSSSKQKLSPVTDDIALKSAPDSDASAIPRSSSKQKLSPVTNDIAVKSAPDSDASAIPRSSSKQKLSPVTDDITLKSAPDSDASAIPRSSSKQKLSPVIDDIALKSAPDSDASAIPRSSSKQKLSPVTNDIAVKSAPDSDASAIPRSSSKQKLSPVTDNIALISAPDNDASAIPRSSSKQKLSPITNDIAAKLVALNSGAHTSAIPRSLSKQKLSPSVDVASQKLAPKVDISQSSIKQKLSPSADVTAQKPVPNVEGALDTDTKPAEATSTDIDMPFCLVTSIEQEFDTPDVVLHSGEVHVNPPPQFMTYDVNRCSNKSSGNFFIDASSLLDDSEISSGDWLQSDKIPIAGVTVSSSEDAEPAAHNTAVQQPMITQPMCQAAKRTKRCDELQLVDLDGPAASPDKVVFPEDLRTLESTTDSISKQSKLENSMTDSLSSKSSLRLGNKLETSVMDSKIHAVFQPQLTTFISVDMTRSAPATSRESRPKSLDCSLLSEPTLSTLESEGSVRREQEKKQGQMLFDSCIPAFSQHVTGSEGQVSGNKLPLTPDTYPSMDYATVNAAVQAKTAEEEIHSPDSLNNDAPAETFCEEPPHKEVVRKQKYDESMPIVSGGVSCEDYQDVKQSPLSRRKVESIPIVCGANLMETPNSSPRFPRRSDATAWVVDMSEPSDVKSPEARRKRGNVINSQLETVNVTEKQEVKRKNSGLGFFVDLSEGEAARPVAAETAVNPVAEEKAMDAEKKKSFFSMYIDIGEGKAKTEVPKRRVFSRETSREEKVSEKEKQGFFMFIEAEPVVRRQSGSAAKHNVNRHSWNAEVTPSEVTKRHKRAQSLCGDKMFRTEETHTTASLSDDVKPEVSCAGMTRSLDESMSSEVKLRTGRGELEPVLENTEPRKQFVRLSDMDTRGTRHEARQPGDGRARTRKVEESSWIESKLMVRGSRTLGRSGGSSFASCHSPSQDTDESELSSMQSSVDRSALDASTEETDISATYPGRGACSRLGEDLLRMFLEEINTDVTVEVAGRRIRAHKCILSSRCQYFAAMLSGGWVESAGNVISLQGFSYHAVHFALSHIYSGTNNIPDSLSIVELATLTDMLGLEGLKEVIMYTLKVKYCHFFHKPCSVCAVGVLECLPLAAAYGLDEIYHKSLRWITKYFVRIWPSKAFASLPRELVDKCYLQHVVHMSVDSVLDTVMSCDRLLATLPSVRWAEAVYSLTSQLLDACVTFMAEHFSGVLTSDRFVSLGKELSWNISRLEDSIMAAVDCLPAEQACQSHTKLARILAVATTQEPPPEMQWSASFVELLQRIKCRVETVLVRLGARAMRCKAWPMLSAALRTRVQEAACLGSDQEEGRRARSLSLTKRGKGRARGSTAPRYSGGRLIGAAPPCFDLRQVTLAMSRGERVPVAHVPPMPPRRGPEGATHPDKSVVARQRQARARPPPDTKASSDTTASGRPKTWPMKVLEQKGARVKPASGGSSATASRTATPEKSAVPARMKASSSESSRTSSPASRDKPRRRPLEPVKSASASHIPVAKPFLSPVLRGARDMASPASKSATELTRTKNSPVPALRSRVLRPSQPKPAVPTSPLRKTECQRPPFKLGTSTENLRKSTLQDKSRTAQDKPRTPLAKRSLKAEPSPKPRREVEGPCRVRPMIPLSQSSSAPAINKGFKPKLLSATSRSGTFLKDEPTVLKKPVS